jgi:hypothetical protein
MPHRRAFPCKYLSSTQASTLIGRKVGQNQGNIPENLAFSPL